MRSIQEIKNDMARAMMRNETLADAYGYAVSTDDTGDGGFSVTFSSVSLESILLYIVAVGIYVLEALFAEHKKEVDAVIEATLPHRPKWYRDKVLQFMVGKTLIEDTDQYDTTGMTEEAVEAVRVVKYAAATENASTSILTIKVAGETNGERAPIASAEETALKAYLSEIKDAGVRIELKNQEADQFHCEVDIYYDAMLTSSSVGAACRKAIAQYIQNLPFNGEYTNMGLIDALQEVDGVRIAEMRSSSVSVSGSQTETAINARHTPEAGYMKAQDENVELNMIPYNGEV